MLDVGFFGVVYVRLIWFAVVGVVFGYASAMGLRVGCCFLVYWLLYVFVCCFSVLVVV